MRQFLCEIPYCTYGAVGACQHGRAPVGDKTSGHEDVRGWISASCCRNRHSLCRSVNGARKLRAISLTIRGEMWLLAFTAKPTWRPCR